VAILKAAGWEDIDIGWMRECAPLRASLDWTAVIVVAVTGVAGVTESAVPPFFAEDAEGWRDTAVPGEADLAVSPFAGVSGSGTDVLAGEEF
jgi:hypothetical protein